MDAEEVQAADARRRMREGGESGGWCAPSACAVGVCTNVFVHDEDCPGEGWAYKVLADAVPGEMLLLPEIKVKRGGIRWPWFRVETAISTHKSHWWSRRSWRVHIRYHDGERNMHHYMTFYKSTDASNAEQIIKFVAQTANEKYWSEKDDRR